MRERCPRSRPRCAELLARGTLAFAGLSALPQAARAEPRTHDGLFVAAGPSVFAPWITQSSSANHFGGLVSGLSLTIGGTPARGLVVGGDLSTVSLEGLQGERGGRFGDGATYSSTKAALTWFPEPRAGHFVEAGAGFGSLSRGTWTSTPPEVRARDERLTWSGIVAHLGAGASAFVADELALAVRLRVEIAPRLSPARDTDAPDTRRYAIVAPSVGVLLSWH
ncbi:MAG: hypothetical protein LC118_17990 [Dehalococcoidia bacterium]|nr:hypothetical protein [Dehalococcoidia bacterium]